MNPDGSGQLYVPGLTEITVQSPEDINKVRTSCLSFSVTCLMIICPPVMMDDGLCFKCKKTNKQKQSTFVDFFFFTVCKHVDLKFILRRNDVFSPQRLMVTLFTCLQVFELGHVNRATACTNLNEHSSRSHALLIITVSGFNTATGNRTLGTFPHKLYSSCPKNVLFQRLSLQHSCIPQNFQ